MLVDAYEVVFVLWRKIFLQCHLLTVISTLGRAFLKLAMFTWLFTNYPNEAFTNSARCRAVRGGQVFGGALCGCSCRWLSCYHYPEIG